MVVANKAGRPCFWLAIISGALLLLIPRLSQAWLFQENRHQQGGAAPPSVVKNKDPPKSRHFYAKSPLTVSSLILQQRWTKDTSIVTILERDNALVGNLSRSLSGPSSPTTRKKREKFVGTNHSVERSLARAMEHMTAIAELFERSSEKSNDDDDELSERSIYGSILLNTLDAVVQALLDEPDTITASALDQINNMTRHVFQREQDANNGGMHLLLVPSSRTLNSLWMVHQYRYQNIQLQTSYSESASSIHMFVQRCLDLLEQWTYWANKATVAPPPPVYLLQVSQVAARYNVTMTPQLWSLFCTHTSQESEHSGILPRELFSNVLQILSQSTDLYWKSHQIRICRQLVNWSTYYENLDFLPTRTELFRALEAVSESGQASDAAWLIRAMAFVAKKQETLLNSTATKDPVSDVVCSSATSLFLTALQLSNETGSFRYMEEYLTNHRHLLKDETASYNKLLSKWATSGNPGAGAQTERILQLFEPDTNSYYWVDFAKDRTLTRNEIPPGRGKKQF